MVSDSVMVSQLLEASVDITLRDAGIRNEPDSE